jgi:hypothetical protein
VAETAVVSIFDSRHGCRCRLLTCFVPETVMDVQSRAFEQTYLCRHVWSACVVLADNSELSRIPPNLVKIYHRAQQVKGVVHIDP